MDTIDFPAGRVDEQSAVSEGGVTYFMARLHESGERCLGILGDAAGFSDGRVIQVGLTICPPTPDNARALRARLGWLNPTRLGTAASFGLGDRIGLATPGHIQALRSADSGGRVAPIFAQQSVRENARTGRTPQQVMDDATWGVFREGWHRPWGADADHVKELADLPPFLTAGYTFFTIDPSDHVDNAAQTDPLDALRAKSEGLPWDVLQSSYTDMQRRYCRGPFLLDELRLEFDEPTLRRALAKYGRAMAHTVTVAGAISSGSARPFDLEMSVDETDTPTSAQEHFFIASELARCAVPVTSLAPRFIGKFQKGIDYIGDAAEFERDLAWHAAIMRHFGTYKLSIHTGSDKFSIYPAIARHTGGHVHVKTAGTSYLEALRIAAQLDPALFRRMLGIARTQFEHDRKTYFLDARLDRVPAGETLADTELPALLDQLDARQVLHVTFGSILGECGSDLRGLLAGHEAGYAAALETHFARHIQPFV